MWWDGRDNQTFVSFNARGRITIPQFYLPAVQSFTVELLVSLRCTRLAIVACSHCDVVQVPRMMVLRLKAFFASSTSRQCSRRGIVVVSRKLNVACRPRILIDGNQIAAYVNLNDPERNSSYFMKMDSVSRSFLPIAHQSTLIHVSYKVRAANGNSSFPASSWHHVALIFNGSHLNLHINGTLR